MHLETQRLRIRPFLDSDLAAIHSILALSFAENHRLYDPAALAERQSWLHWSILSQKWFTNMHQPPYGDLAVTLKSNGDLIGSVGLVPCLDFFDQIPELNHGQTANNKTRTEMGLFWAIAEEQRGQGYATEAARAMVDYAFDTLHLGQLIATTTYDNLASQAVMRKLGMSLQRNPFTEPAWLQVVGLLHSA